MFLLMNYDMERQISVELVEAFFILLCSNSEYTAFVERIPNLKNSNYLLLKGLKI